MTQWLETLKEQNKMKENKANDVMEPHGIDHIVNNAESAPDQANGGTLL